MLDTTSGSWGDGRQVTPICVGASQMDLASATRGGELCLPRYTVSVISEMDNGACLQQPDLGAWGCVVVDYQISILHVFHNYLY